MQLLPRLAMSQRRFLPPPVHHTKLITGVSRKTDTTATNQERHKHWRKTSTNLLLSLRLRSRFFLSSLAVLRCCRPTGGRASSLHARFHSRDTFAMHQVHLQVVGRQNLAANRTGRACGGRVVDRRFVLFDSGGCSHRLVVGRRRCPLRRRRSG